MKKFSPGPVAAPRIDQCADIRIARRDDAIEWGIYLLEGLQFFQPLDVGFRGLNGGLLGRQVSVALSVSCLETESVFNKY